MTIWILALVLLASLAGLGYRQGAIRVAFSFLGIILGGALAMPLGNKLAPLLPKLGLKSPVLVAFAAPIIVFIIFSIIFKIAGRATHKKVEVYYKYKAGDLRLALWERIMRRLGLCLGLVNAVAYLLLISILIHAMSYWTYQLASSGDPFPLKALNRAGSDLHSSGLHKAVNAIDPVPASYYDAADVAGLVYQNPALLNRLASYPSLLLLGETQPLQEIGNDPEYWEMLQRKSPLREILNHTKTKAVLNNPNLLRDIWAALSLDRADLIAFLNTGRSAKFGDEPILGRWRFDISGSMTLLRKTRPNLPAPEIKRLRPLIEQAMSKTSLMAAPNNTAVLRNVLRIRPNLQIQQQLALEQQTLNGTWAKQDGGYRLSVTGQQSEELQAMIEGEKLIVQGDGISLAFARQE